MTKIARIFAYLLAVLLISAWTLPSAGFSSPGQSDVTVLSIQAPPAAIGGNLRLTVNNKTDAVIERLVLTGPKTYVFVNIPLGKSTYRVFPGSYKFEYQACGSKNTKTDKIRFNYKLTIQCKLSKIQVVNETGSNLYLSLYGPSNYRFTILPGTTKISVLQGTYKFQGTSTCISEFRIPFSQRKSKMGLEV